MKDFLPHGNQPLASWTRNMANTVSASPGAFGLSAAQAAEYVAVQQAYAEALRVTTDPETRTRPTIAAKDDARAALIALTRRLARIIQVYPGTTDAMRQQLGLTVRKKRARMAAVTIERPTLRVVWAMGSRLTLRVGKVEGLGRARPVGAKGYTWFYYVGEQPPSELGHWSFGGNVLEPTVEVALSGVEPGSPVWFAANWFNSRLQPGPMSTPIMTRVGGGFTGVAPDGTASPGRRITRVVANGTAGSVAEAGEEGMGLAA